MKLLVTGGSGFIGSNFIRYWLQKYPDDSVINLDLLTYAGCETNLVDVAKNGDIHYRFVHGDITNDELVNRLVGAEAPDVIVNFAAESHNSWAIIDPGKFLRTNVLGTQVLADAARRHKTSRFHQISTCEVYGDLALDSPERFSEESPYRPQTPYNASKAAADLVVRSYVKTFGLPATISNCCNNYGPYQFPEKLIPLFVTKLLRSEPVTIYQSSQHKREWLHVLDHCRALDAILRRGRIGETYNVGSGNERTVEEIAASIFHRLNKPRDLWQYVPDRPQHDRRYLLDSSKIGSELGWQPEIELEHGLGQTVDWYVANPAWWQPLLEKNRMREDRWTQTAT